jgi:hypothetical protein
MDFIRKIGIVLFVVGILLMISFLSIQYSINEIKEESEELLYDINDIYTMANLNVKDEMSVLYEYSESFNKDIPDFLNIVSYVSFLLALYMIILGISLFRKKVKQ